LTGDGGLAEFPSAVDALGTAIEFQEAMVEASREQPEDTAIVFRVGMRWEDDAIVAAVHSVRKRSFPSSAAERGFPNKALSFGDL
jgi:class 3 adenylate cyclase